MHQRQKRSTKKDRHAEARARIEGLPKLSETLLQFAKPLLDTLSNPPPIEELRQVMVLVTVAWNLPLYEQRKRPEAAAYRPSPYPCHAPRSQAAAGRPPRRCPSSRPPE